LFANTRDEIQTPQDLLSPQLHPLRFPSGAFLPWQFAAEGQIYGRNYWLLSEVRTWIVGQQRSGSGKALVIGRLFEAKYLTQKLRKERDQQLNLVKEQLERQEKAERRRDAQAARKLMVKLLKKHGFAAEPGCDRPAAILSGSVPRDRAHG
jgi:hypothetical protein